MNDYKILRILQVVPNMHAAGLETLIMNIYRNIDHTKVQFDFLVHYQEDFFYDEEIRLIGGEIYKLSFRNDGNIFKYIKDLDHFFSLHKYDVVHGHMASTACFYLGIAKKYGIPVRIIHSHNTSTERTLKGFIKHKLLKYSTLFANQYFACAEKAGKYLYGKHDFTIIHNAINLDVFTPNSQLRTTMRLNMDLDDKFIVGHIGRFNTQKNHKFMINIFAKLLKIVPKSVLVLVGEGELESNIIQQIAELGIQDNVKLLGVRKDINAIYNMLDVFILPSLFEGLPVVGIESQATGTLTLMSDKISREVQVSQLVEFLPIDTSNAQEKWVKKLVEIANSSKIIAANELKRQLQRNGYDINKEAEKLIELYKTLIKSKKYDREINNKK